MSKISESYGHTSKTISLYNILKRIQVSYKTNHMLRNFNSAMPAAVIKLEQLSLEIINIIKENYQAYNRRSKDFLQETRFSNSFPN